MAVDPSIRRLVQAAGGAARRAYALHSEFRVGAALLDASGRISTGANIENAAYPLGICAERTAPQLWRSEGGRDRSGGRLHRYQRADPALRALP